MPNYEKESFSLKSSNILIRDIKTSPIAERRRSSDSTIRLLDAPSKIETVFTTKIIMKKRINPKTPRNKIEEK